MDTVSTLVNVALIWSVAAATPGPNFVLMTRTVAGGSRRLGLATAAGIGSGTLVWGLAGFFGISALFAAAPWLYVSLKVAGGLYIVYLGLRLIATAGRSRVRARPATGNIASGPSRRSLAAAWRLGLLTNLSNPKTAAFVTSLFATTMPADPALPLGLTAAAVMTGVTLIWYGAVAWVFASAPVIRWYARAAKHVDRAAGALFVLFGARLMLER
jgi:threonine/homoserine/homoserine lactone efflux protein